MKLPITTWGSGSLKALFLHGFTGGHDAFAHLEPLLGDVLSATCVDLPGHRGAPLPTAQATEGFFETVDSLARLLTEPSVVVGYSQGARVALGLTIRHPHLVSRLVLESVSPGLRQRHARARRRSLDEGLAQLILERGVEPFVEKWENLPLFTGLRALPEADRRALRSRRSAHTAEGLAGALRCLGQGVQPDFWPALPTMHVPTLLLTGSTDEKYTRVARSMSAELPLAWRVTFRGVGHAPHLESPEAYAAELRAFLVSHWTHEPKPEEMLLCN